MQSRLNQDREAIGNLTYSKINRTLNALSEKKQKEDPLYQECLKKAEGNELRALAIYRYRTSDQQETIGEDLDQKEKWPMLAPLIILYSLGTIGVLLLVFGFLANRLNWW